MVWARGSLYRNQERWNQNNGGTDILGNTDEQIEWGRVYLEPVEEDDETWDEAIAEGEHRSDGP